MMRVGNLEVILYPEGKTATVTKHYNEAVRKQIDLIEDDIYALEFVVKEIKRQLDLK